MNGVPNTRGAVQEPRTNGMPEGRDSLSTLLRSGASRTAKRAGSPTYISTNSAMNGCAETHSSCS